MADDFNQNGGCVPNSTTTYGSLVSRDTRNHQSPLSPPLPPPEIFVEQALRLSVSTKAVCTSCGRPDAPFLYLKRHKGLYQMLCMMGDGRGCYPSSTRTLCSYVLPAGYQCDQLAEWEIRFTDSRLHRIGCTDHIGMLLANSSEQRIYPLED